MESQMRDPHLTCTTQLHVIGLSQKKNRYQVYNAEPFLLLLPDCLHIYMLGNSDLREVQWRDCVDQVQIDALVTSE